MRQISVQNYHAPNECSDPHIATRSEVEDSGVFFFFKFFFKAGIVL